MKIYFFGGIHGVGKTTLCNRLSNQLNIKHFSSGELINKNVQRNKEVENINLNQDVLLTELQYISNQYNSIILDGHYTLLSKGHIKNIPKNIYYEMNIAKMFLIISEVKNIYNRISIRDNKQYDIDLLYKMHEAEICR